MKLVGSAVFIIALCGCSGAVEHEDAFDGSVDGGTGSDAEQGSTCNQNGWAEFDAQSLFSFRAPCSVHGGPEQGIDSYVGSYADVGMRFGYDYGSYSSPLTEWSDENEYELESVVIDGRAAYVVTARDQGAPDGLSRLFGLHVPDVNANGTRLTIDGRCDTPERLETAIRILKSTSFP